MLPTALPSRIDAVTVYRRGAGVTRVAELTPQDGALPPAVRLGGLSLTLDDSSVRARVEPLEAGGAAPIAHDLRVALDVPARDADLRPADDAELEAARAEVAELERLVAQLERELSRLEHLALVPRPPGAEGERPPPSPLSARRSLIELRAARERKLYGELRETRERLDRARRRRDLLEDQDRRASRARQAREHELRKAVIVSLRGAAAPCRLVVDYLVPGARWAPAYSLRLEPGMTAARLALRAHVAQDTGEDWNQVALTLSTAAAQAWTELPELASLRIGRRQPPPPRVGWRPPPSGVDELYRDWDRAFASLRARSAPGRREITTAAPRPAELFAPEPVPEELDDEVTAVNPLAGAAAAPGMAISVSRAAAPPPPSAGMPLAAPPAPVVARATAPAMAARAKPPRRRRAAAEGAEPAPKAELAREREEEEAAAVEEVGPLAAPAELLRYGDLRMPPARSPSRGRLTPAGRHRLYLELLAEARVRVRFDVVGAVEGARARAIARTEELPPGCEPVWTDAFDHAFPADARVDVPSDGDYHSVPLFERAATCEPLYVVVPRESTDVFRTALVESPLDAPLLPGPADVYLGSDFLLTTRVDATPPGGRLTLGLGVEQGIKVARNARFREETAGLIGNALLLKHQISVEVRNNLPGPAPLEVRERVPAVEEKDDEVEVRVTHASPAWQEWRQEPEYPGEVPLRGGRVWRVTVPPGGRQELRADYEIKISSKHELAGGNRREA